MSEENDKPSYWAVLTADILFDNKLSSNEKVLYAVISSLQRMNGYCYASNAYFEKILEKDERTIKRWIKSLEEKGHISVRYVYKTGSKQIDKRIITIKVKDVVTEMPPYGDKNVTRGGDKNGLDISNPYSTDNSNKKEEIVCSNEHTKEDNSDMENLFEVFWTKYPKKQSKKVAKVSFMRYVSKNNIRQVLDGLDRWLRSKQWHEKNGQYIPYPATWLNQERWNDELKQEDLVDGGEEDFLNDDDEYDLCDPRRYREKESNDFIDADYTTKA